MTNNPSQELYDAGVPSLPIGYFYAFNVQENGDLYGAIFDPGAQKKASYVRPVSCLFHGLQQTTTWTITDLVILAEALNEIAFPVSEPHETFAPNIIRFLDVPHNI